MPAVSAQGVSYTPLRGICWRPRNENESRVPYCTSATLILAAFLFEEKIRTHCTEGHLDVVLYLSNTKYGLGFLQAYAAAKFLRNDDVGVLPRRTTSETSARNRLLWFITQLSGVYVWWTRDRDWPCCNGDGIGKDTSRNINTSLSQSFIRCRERCA